MVTATHLVVVLAVVSNAVTCPTDSCTCTENEDVNCARTNSRYLDRVPAFHEERGVTYNEIDLRLNEIESVGPLAFGRLNVRRITLSGNSIDGVSPRAFDGLEDLLEYLDLTGNRLAVIHWGVFRGLQALRELYIARNGIFALPRGLFDGLTNLEILDLSRNRLTKIRYAMFRHLANMKKINFDGNDIDNIAPNTFNDMRQLVELNLQNNRLTNIMANSTQGLENLRTLNLADNDLYRVPTGTFLHLHSLQALNLTSNNITSLLARSFTDARSLKLVDLSNNRISSVHIDAFYGVQNLTRLILKNNEITVMGEPPCTINYLNTLRELDLSGNTNLECDCTRDWLLRINAICR